MERARRISRVAPHFFKTWARSTRGCRGARCARARGRRSRQRTPPGQYFHTSAARLARALQAPPRGEAIALKVSEHLEAGVELPWKELAEEYGDPVGPPFDSVGCGNEGTERFRLSARSMRKERARCAQSEVRSRWDSG